MNELLNSYFIRIFRTKSFWYGLVFSVLMPCTSIASLISGEEDKLGELAGQGGMALIMLPMIIAAVIGLNISPEFAQGTIRNQLIVGHKKRSVYLTALICGLVIAAVYFAAFHGALLAVGAAFGTASSLTAKTVAESLGIVLVLLLGSAAISVFVCMTIHDAKSTVFALMTQYALMCFYMLKMMITDDEFGGDTDSAVSRVFEIIGRFFAQGQVGSLSIVHVPDKPALVLLCSLALSAVMTLGGMRLFEKSDLK